MLEKIEAYSNLLNDLAYIQGQVRFYQRFQGNPITVLAAGFVAFLLLFQIAELWAIVLAVLIALLTFICEALTARSPNKVKELRKTLTEVYRGHNLLIKRASLVQVSGYYYCWIFGQEELTFQVERASLATVRNGLVALSGLGATISDFTIPLKIKVNGRIPASTFHPAIRFSANACFLEGVDCETIVQRFHTKPEEVETVLRGYIARHINATIAAVPHERAHKTVWHMRNTMVEITDLNAEACITEIGFT